MKQYRFGLYGMIIGAILMFQYMPREKHQIKTVETERIVIEENNKKTTIYRTVKRDEKKSTIQTRKWTAKALIDPVRRDRYELGLGYEVLPNISLEGSWGPYNGSVMVGVGVKF